MNKDASILATAHQAVSSPARALVRHGATADEALHFEDLIATTTSADESPCGLERMAQALGLSAFERDVIALVGLPDEHEDFAMLARRLHPLGEPRMTIAGIAAVLELDEIGRRHLRRALEVGSLYSFGIVTIADGLPLPEATLALPRRLWSALRGLKAWPAGIDPRPIEAPAQGRVDRDQMARLLAPGARVVMITGASERSLEELASYARSALDSLGRASIFVDGPSLTTELQRPFTLHALAIGAVPVVIGAPPGEALTHHPALVIICTSRESSLELDDRPAVTIDLGSRQFPESVAMWSRLAPELNGESATLAATLRVDPIRAAQAVQDARVAADGTPLSISDIVGTVRRRTDRDLPSSVRLVQPRSSWKSLVTTQRNEQQLQTIVTRMQNQVQVLHDWGFGGRILPGVKALFAGPPGTGKTLSAEIIAAALDLDLLVVDLSALVSKWLGETEKNLSEVFDAAERCQSVLFFDEADAMFGRRTEGSDAQGRWANLETAHLLTRIDGFSGLCVLASNMRTNIDAAFVRRLDVIVEFEEPDADARLSLWQGHLPANAPLADDVNLGQLAELYPLTGGLISNATVAAAFQVAQTNRPIDQRSLLDASEQEYHKAGRSFPGKPRSIDRIPAGGD